MEKTMNDRKTALVITGGYCNVEAAKNLLSTGEYNCTEIAYLCGFSDSAQFASIFRRETGQPFVGYLTEFRMNKAAELLISGNEKTYIVATKVGYSDPNYFSYVFRRRYGVSPSKYKGR